MTVCFARDETLCRDRGWWKGHAHGDGRAQAVSAHRRTPRPHADAGAFHEFDPEMHLVVVLPADQQDYWRALCERYQFDLPHALVTGVPPVSTLRAMDWI